MVSLSLEASEGALSRIQDMGMYNDCVNIQVFKNELIDTAEITQVPDTCTLG